MKLDVTEMVYVRSMGKLLRVTAMFRDDDDANKYMRKNPDEALVAIVGPDIKLMANVHDKGVTIDGD